MRSVDRVRDYFIQRGIPIDIKELPSSTRTAQLAADAVGTTLGSIVKSLVFIADSGDHIDNRTSHSEHSSPATNRQRAVLTLVAGDRRADPEKIARCINARSARIANADEVRTATSYAIGGVPPVAHSQMLETLVDQTLLRFDKVWAAAGAPNAVFEIEMKILLELTRGRVEDIVTADQQG